MNQAAVIEALEAAESPRDAARILGPHKGQSGLSSTYFTRVFALYASDPDATLKLARWWRELLTYGDDPALAYRAKGAADRLQGKWLASARAFLRAGEAAANARDRLVFQIGAIDGLARSGRVDEAVELGRKLVDGLSRLREPGQVARVRFNVGVALQWADRYKEARAWLEKAVPELEAGGHKIEAASARLSISSSHLFGGDPFVAREKARAAHELASSMGADYLAALCEINLAHAYLILGRADEALRLLLAARTVLESSPTDQVRITEYLGDAYLRLNLWPEAVDAYSEAEGLSRFGTRGNLANVHLGLGQALLALGEREQAATHFRKARKGFKMAGLPGAEAVALTYLSEMQVKHSPSRAHRMACEATELASKVKSHYHEVQALMARAATAAAVGAHEPHVLRRADALVRRYGYAPHGWRLHKLRAEASTGSIKLRHYRRMFDEILEGRLGQASLSSRATYLRDKSDAIGDYLGLLLSAPTKRRVEEAVRVIERSRSVALLDEIVSASGDALGSAAVARLQALREELQALAGDGYGGEARRAATSGAELAAIQRRWIEATHQIQSFEPTPLPASEQECVILTEAGEDLYSLWRGKARKLPIGRSDLISRLRWLQFELLAPMADREADASGSIELLRELAELLVDPWLRGDGADVRLSVEGVLWKVPWAGCFAALQLSHEPVLCLHPSFSCPVELRQDSNMRAMIWAPENADLPNAKLEEARFLDCFPQARVCRTRAEALEHCDTGVDVLHVIGHAQHNAGNPMFSQLSFPDGPLFATEIARSGLRVSFVTLSACDTGAITAEVRTEPDGLARAFLARGAKSVLGSAWPLDDEAAGRAYACIYAKLSDKLPFIEALRDARAALRDWRSHPYFWSSLTLFGGYRS